MLMAPFFMQIQMEHHSLLNSFWTFSISADSECSECLSKKKFVKKRRSRWQHIQSNLLNLHLDFAETHLFLSQIDIHYIFFPPLSNSPSWEPAAADKLTSPVKIERLVSTDWTVLRQECHTSHTIDPCTKLWSVFRLSSNTTQCGCRKKRGWCGLEKSDILFNLS